jgi:hypothetical protein
MFVDHRPATSRTSAKEPAETVVLPRCRGRVRRLPWPARGTRPRIVTAITEGAAKGPWMAA